jgi:hypothetical protein
MTSDVGTMLVTVPAVKLRLLTSVIVNGCPLGTVINGGCQPLVCANPFAAVHDTPDAVAVVGAAQV